MAKIRRFLCVASATIVLGACTSEVIPPPLPAGFYESSPATVRRVQIALRDRGYYHGSADGYLGQDTAYAIERFQVDHYLRVKAVIDRPLLVGLGLAHAHG